jgi:PEP-CTERM motif-containing protein
VTAASPGILSNQAVHIANDFGNVREQTISITGQIDNFAAVSLLKVGREGTLRDSFVLDFGNVQQGSGTEAAMLAIFNDNPLADQLLTDLLSTTATVVSGSGFRFTSCSVRDLPVGSKSECDIFFDTDLAGMFTELLDIPVESSNSSGYDQVIGHVTLTLEGSVGPVTTPEPSTMIILGSGLGTLIFVVRRRRRTG